jgi:carboxyl-terminal processing protease
MFATLRPFLGEGVVGSISGRTAPEIWRADAFVKVTPPRPLRKLEQARVAVLTSQRTASAAGEAVTVAFRGRGNTRTFGTPTAGVSTANVPFRLRDGATIVLTTAIYVDRTGKRYGDKIEPDETTEDALPAATAWLRTGCGEGSL